MTRTYTQEELDAVISEAKTEVYREFRYKDWGTPDVRICPECGRPDVHWSVSSSLNCRDCKQDFRLARTAARVEQLEAFLKEKSLELPGPIEFWEDRIKKIPPHERIILRIEGGDGVGLLVNIYADGHIVYGENYNPDQTAKLFWECMMQYSPAQLEHEEAKKKAVVLKKMLVDGQANYEKAIQLLEEIASGKF